MHMFHQPVPELKRRWLQEIPLGLDISKITDDDGIPEIKNDIPELKRRWLQGIPLGLAVHPIAKDPEPTPAVDASAEVHLKSNFNKLIVLIHPPRKSPLKTIYLA